MSRRAQRAMALLMLHHQAMGGGVPPVPPALIAEVRPAEPLTWPQRMRQWWQAVREYCTFIFTDIDGGW